jgi:hypothetical protein
MVDRSLLSLFDSIGCLLKEYCNTEERSYAICREEGRRLICLSRLGIYLWVDVWEYFTVNDGKLVFKGYLGSNYSALHNAR